MRNTASKFLLFSLSLLLLTGVAVAGLDMLSFCPAGPFFSLLGGSSWASSGENASVNFGGLATNRYQADTSSIAIPFVGIDVGYRWQGKYWATLGLETSWVDLTSPEGSVRPLFFINPNFDTLQFTYAVTAVPLFVIGQFGTPLWVCVHMDGYVIGGVGVSWNRANLYREIPTDPNASAAPMRAMFQSNMQANFAYTVGAGLTFRVARATDLGMEYRFTDYGAAQFNNTAGQATADGLALGSVYSNALVFRLGVTWA